MIDNRTEKEGQWPDLIDFARSETGSSSIEYGILAGLVGISLIGGLQALSESVTALYQDVGDSVSDIHLPKDSPLFAPDTSPNPAASPFSPQSIQP